MQSTATLFSVCVFRSPRLVGYPKETDVE